LEKEPELFRIWMPDEDCPGLAMAMAFGDFCLKDYGLISTPEVSYRRVTDKDEFVVLATDGVRGTKKQIFLNIIEVSYKTYRLIC
jgi:serine/threonine protein phosphatase PrpC